MVVVNAENGKVITTLPIGEGPDGCAFDPGTKRAFSSNGDGTMTVVQEVNANTFKVLENVKTERGARTITLDKKTHHIYLPTAKLALRLRPPKTTPGQGRQWCPAAFEVLEIVPAG